MPATRAYISSLKQLLTTDLSGRGADAHTTEQAWLILFDLLKHEDLNLLTPPQLEVLLEEHSIPTAVRPESPETTARQLLVQFVRAHSLHQRDILLGGYILALKARGCSKATIKNYLSDIRQIFGANSEKHVEGFLTETRLRDFIEQQEKAQLAPRSIRRKLTTAAQFGKWLEAQDVIDHETADSIYQLSQTYGRPDGEAVSVPATPPAAVVVPAAAATATPALAAAPVVAVAPLVAPITPAALPTTPQPLQISTPTPVTTGKPIVLHEKDKAELQREAVAAKLQADTRRNEVRSKSDSVESIVATPPITTVSPVKPPSRPRTGFARFLPKMGIQSAVTTLALVLSILGLGLLFRMQFLQNVAQPLAYPTALTRPTRSLSFQGRLTDSAQNPITGPTNMNFKLYDTGPSTSGGSVLWDSGTCSIDPDQDGIFSAGLGDDCGSEIDNSVFSEHTSVWLQITVGAEVLSPRQPIKAVAYALNSETVQGYPASASAVENTVVVMNNSGEIVLGNSNPKIKATSTNGLTLEGQSLYLTTTAGSNGNVVLRPDGTGLVVATRYIAAPGATLSATYAGGNALTINGTASSSGVLSFIGTTDPKINVLNGEAFGIRTSVGGDAGLTERLTILSNGNVGINTTSPTAKLAIDQGAVTNQPALVISNVGAGTSGITVDHTGAAIAHLLGTSGGKYHNTYTNGGGLEESILGNVGGFADGAFRFSTDANAAGAFSSTVRIKAGAAQTLLSLQESSGTEVAKIGYDGGAYFAGNVGIGTTGPTQKLDIDGQIRIRGGSPAVGRVLTSDANGVGTWADIASLTSNYWQMNLGTLSPFSNSLDLLVGGNSTASAKFAFMNVNNGTPTASISGNLAIAVPTGATPATTYNILNGGSFNLQTSVGGNAGLTSRLTVLNNGNVGIGSTTPGYKLDVAGDINTSGTYRMAGVDYGQYFIDSAGSTGRIWQSDGSGRGIWTTATYPTTTSANQLLYSSSANTITGLASAANSVLVTNGSSVPSLSTDLPTAVTIGGSYIYRAGGTDVAIADGGTNTSSIGSGGSIAYSTGTAYGFSGVGTSGYLLTSGGTGAPTWTNPASFEVPLTFNNGLTRTGNTVKLGGTLTANTDVPLAGFDLTFSGSGRVGIGTTSPGAALDVNGSVLVAGGGSIDTRAAGSLTIGGTTQNNLILGRTGVTTRIANLTTNGVVYTSGGNGTLNSEATLATARGGLGANMTAAGAGEIPYSTSTTAYGHLAAGTSGQVLRSNGAAAPSWVDIASLTSNYWQMNLGALAPFSNSLDLLVGSNSTASAKFAFMNVNSGTPTASISGNLAIAVPTGATPATTYNILNGGSFNLQTSVGGNAGLTSRLTVLNNGNIGIGSTSPTVALDVAGSIKSSALTSGRITFATTGGQLTDSSNLTWNGNQLDISGSSNPGFRVFNPAGSNGWYFYNGAGGAGNFGMYDMTAGADRFVIKADGTIDLGNTYNSPFVRIGSTGTVTVTNLNSGGIVKAASGTGLLSVGQVDLTSEVTGTLPAVNGGTGQNSYAVGDLLYANTTTTLAKLAGVATGNVLISGGVNTAPSWGKVGLATHVSGLLPLANGGTNADLSAAANGGVAWKNGSALNVTAQGTSGQVLRSNGASAPTWVDAATLGTNYWQMNLGTLSPFSNSLDLLVGSNATTSAKFAFMNVNSGTPTASISGNLAIAVPTGANPATTYNVLNGGSFNLQTSVGGNAGLTSRLFIANNGNVGIGTTNPLAKLDVRGSGRFGDGTNYAEFDADGDLMFTGTSDYLVGANRYAFRFSASENAGLYFNFTQGGYQFTDAAAASIMHIGVGDNNVGIGTVVPTARLDVAGDASSSGMLTFRGTTDPKINVLNGEHFGIRTSVGGDAGLAERLTVLNNGNVGVGSTTPGYKLDVAGDINTSGTYRMGGTDYGQYFIDSQGTTGQMWRSDGSGRGAWSTATYPNTTTANQILYSSANNTVTGLATAANGVLVTSAGSVPSISTNLPTAVTIGGSYIYRAGGTDVAIADGGTNTSSIGSGGSIAYSTGTAYGFSGVGTSGYLLTSGGTGAPTWTNPASFEVPLTFNNGLTRTGNTVKLGGTLTANTDIPLAGYNLTFSGSGNVGIGTSSVSNPLKVYGTTTGFTPALWVSDQNSTLGGVMYFEWRGAAVNNKIKAFVADSNGLSFYRMNDTGTAFVNATPDLVMSPAGNVGVGVSSPANLFSVGSGSPFQVNSSGQIAAAAGITSSGNITFSGLNAGGIVKAASGTGLLSVGSIDLSTSEVSGVLTLNKGGTNKNITPSAGAVVYSDADSFELTGVGTPGQVLSSNGSSAPTWVDAATLSTNYWQMNLGTLSPFSNSLDLLVGGNSTASAKFAFMNVNSGTPTASISGNLSIAVPTSANPATTYNVLRGGSFNLQTSVGGDAGLASRLFVANGGNVGVGTTSPYSLLSVHNNSLGASPSFYSGFSLVNTTAATPGNVKLSPDITWQGNRYLTAMGGTTGVYFRSFVVPVDESFTDNYLTFQGNDGATGWGGDILVMTTGRNVGVGTTAPAGRFAVVDNVNTAASLSLTNNTATTIGAGGNTLGVLDLQSTSLTTGNFMNIETNGLTTGTALNISRSGAGLTTNGELVNLDMGAATAGNGMNVTTTGVYTGTGLLTLTANSATTGTLAAISANGLTSGTGLSITRSGAGLTTNGELIDLNMGAATAGNGLNITTTGAYTGTGLINLTANSATTGTVTNIAANGLTTGVGLNLSSSSTAMTSGSLIRATWSGAPAGSWTGDLARFEITGNNANIDGNALKVGVTAASTAGANSTALNVTSAGPSGAYVARFNDDGTYTDSTPVVINHDGNLGVGTASPAVALEVGGAGLVRINSLTASMPVKTDASKNLVSGAIDLATAEVTGLLPLTRGGTNADLSGAVNGGVAWKNGSAINVTAQGTTGQILQSNGASAPTWVDAVTLGTNYWQMNLGALAPFSNSLDLLIGSNATTSAKFAFMNVNSGTPTASISGNLAIAAPTGANPATTYNVLNGGSFNLRTSVGGDAGLASRFFVANNGSVGIGTTTPGQMLDVQGAAQFGSGNVNLIDSTGKITGLSSTYFNADTSANLASILTDETGSGGGFVRATNPTLTTLVVSSGGIAVTGNSTIAGTLGSLTGLTSSGTITFSGLSAGGMVKAAPGTGVLSIATAGTDYEVPLTFNNGLTRSSNIVKLGGTLTANTDIPLAGFDLVFSGSGRVGIGTTGPTAMLDVNGSVAIAGGGGIDTRAAGTLTIGGATQTGLTLGRAGANTTINGGDIILGSQANATNEAVRADRALTAGNGLTGGGNLTADRTFAISSPTCTGGNKLQWSGTAFTCVADLDTNYWQLNLGAVSPFSNSLDLLVGSNATASAKFAFMNVNSGTPTASISGNLAIAVPTGATPATTYNVLNGGTFNLQTSVGGNAGLTSRLTVLNNGNIGVGSTTPAQKLDVAGNLQFSGALMPGGDAGTNGWYLQSTGAGTAPVWTNSITASNMPFSGITSGTNTTAAMVVGTGASLNFSGSGTINASSLQGATWAAPLAIGTTTPAAGNFTTIGATAAGSANFTTVNVSSLNASSAVYTDGSKNLTSTAPTSGAIGYWSRTGTTLSPTTANDVVSISSNITTGAVLGATTTGTYTGTGAFAFTANSATTGTVAAISANGLTSGTGLSITRTGAGLTTNGELIDLNMGAATAGNGLNIATTGVYTGTGLLTLTANSATTGTIQAISANGLTTGAGLTITRSGAGLTTNGRLLELNMGAATAGNGVNITTTGAYTGTGLLNLTANSATTGTIANIAANGLTTGTALSLSSSATAMTSGSLIRATWSGAPSGSWTGDLGRFEITGNNANIDGNALKVGITAASTAGANSTALNVTSAGPSGAFVARFNDDGTYTDSTPMVINHDGNLGIGTTNPTEKLTVVSASNSLSTLQTNGTVSLATWLGTNSAAIGTLTNSDLGFFTNDSAYHMTLTTGGNLGVGTETPGSKLEVVGTIAATGINGFISSPYAIVAPKTLVGAGAGALTSVGTTATGTGPAGVAIDPSGRFAYVANNSSTTVQAYTINQSTGALTNVGTTATGTSPIGVAVDPSGRFAYVANAGAATVQAYTINQSTGALTNVGTTATGTTPRQVTVDPTGRFVYVANYSSTTVQAYTINQSTGALTSVGTAATGTNPDGVTVDPSGRFVYVANGGSNNVQAYTINQSTGALTNVGTIATGSAPNSVTVDPSGRFAYVTNSGAATVQAYSINQSTGALTSLGTAGTGTNPQRVAVDPTGRFVYVTNSSSTTVQAYSINQSTGALTSLGTAGTGAGPSGVAIDPSGRFAYVTNNGTTTVQAYTINSFSAGSGYFAGNLGIGTSSPAQKLTVEGTLGILEGGGSPTYHTIFQGGDQTGDITYTLPTAQAGGAGYILTNNGSGVLSWTSPGSGGVNWNDIGNPTGNQSLTMGANTSAWTYNSLTSGTGLTVSSSSLTTGSLIDLTSTSTALTSGGLINATWSGAPASSWTGALAKFEVTGNNANIDGDAVRIGITNASTAGSIGTALNVTRLGPSGSYVARFNDDGTYTDTSPFVIAYNGNVGVGTTTTSNAVMTVAAPNSAGVNIGRFLVGATEVFTINTSNGLTLNAGGAGNGAIPNALNLGIKGAINVTAETIPVRFTAPTYTITGSYANQRITQFTQPTITAASALGISSEANTVNIAGAPISAGSATIANSIALRISSTTSVASGVTNAYGLYVSAPTGATNNYAAVFDTGNVGIGTTAPAAALTVGTAGQFQVTNAGLTSINVNNTTGSSLGVTNTGVYTGTGVFNLTANSATTGTLAAISGTALTSGAGLVVQGPTSGSTFTGSLLQANTNTTGAASNGFVRFNFSGNHTGNGVQLDDVTTAGTAMAINTTGLTTGAGLVITRTGAGLTTNGRLLDLNMGAATAGNGLNITTTGAYTGTGLLNLTANSATTGTIANIAANGLTTGVGLNLSSSSTAMTSGSLIRATWSGAPAGSWTGDLARFEITGNNANIDGSALKVGVTTASTAGAASTALNVTSAGPSGAYVARFNDDGTYTDTTPIIINHDGNLGIGTTDATQKLDIDGLIRIRGGSPAAGRVLSSDANGVGGWVDIATLTTNYWQLAPLGGALSPFSNSLDLLVGSNATASALVKFTGTTGGSSWVNTGNFGIGTTAPIAKLHVAGSILADSLTLSGLSTSIISGYFGHDGYTGFTGGIGTGGNGKDSIFGAQRITSQGNLVNIGSIQAGQTNLTRGGTFATKADYTTGSSPQSVAIGDLNGDGKADLVTANFGTNNISVLINNGNGTFATKVDYTAGTGARSVAIGDLNGDGKADLAVVNSNVQSVSVFINNGNGTFATKVDYTTAIGPYSVAIGDLNGDGKADLAVANRPSNNVSVFINNGNGTFATKADYAVGTNAESVAIGDLNGDGKADLAVAVYSATYVSVLINNGNGTFATQVPYTTGTSPNSVAIGDLNGDGKADLAVTNTGSTSVSVFINNGNGTFAAKVDYTTGSNPYSVAIGDLNGDGKADMAIPNFGSDTVSVFSNNGNGTFATKVDYTVNQPMSVAIGDVNDDGKRDVVAASGWNVASILMNQPQSMFFADAMTGNVGIGTTTPIAKLNVDGSFYFRGGNGDVNGSGILDAGDFGMLASYLGGGSLTPEQRARADINGDGVADRLDLDLIIEVFFSSITLDQAQHSVGKQLADSIISRTYAGNVGIGTQDPSNFKLEVAGSIGPSVDDTYDLGSNTRRWRDLYLGGDSLHIGTSTTDEGLISYNTSTNILNFGTDSTSNGDIAFFTNNLYLKKSTGNVGIGTTNPTLAKLQVESTGTSIYGLSTGSSSTAISGIATGTNGQGVLGTTDGTNGNGVVGWATASSGTTAGVIGISASTGGVGVYGNASGGSGTTIGVWGSASSADGYAFYGTGRSYFSGNVGIGTLTPNNSIQVANLINFDNTDFNTRLGYQTGNNLVSGAVDNTFVGYQAGLGGTMTNTADRNTALGSQALRNLTSGADNTAIGHKALQANTSGSSNMALGIEALTANTTGANNVAMGRNAAWANTTGQSNVAVGLEALRSNTVGYYNTAIGQNALWDLNITSGTQGANVAIGYNTGRGIVTGINNTIIGSNVTGLSSSLSNTVIIADGAGNQRLYINSSGNAGIGTTNPSNFKLEVAGSIGPTVDNTSDLGSASKRWRNLYVSSINTANLGVDNLIFSGLYSSIITGVFGHTGYTNFNGGIGTGGVDSITPAQRLTSAGNLVNIGSIQAGQTNLSRAGTFAAKVDYTTGTNPNSVAVGDVNGDGKADLAVTNSSSTSVSVFINNGNGTFAAKVDYTTGTGPNSVVIGDLNGDGKADLAVTNQSSNSVSIFMNNGNGTFVAKVDYTTGSSPRRVAIGDLNGDGKADLAVASNGITSVSVLINNGDGTFATKVDYATGTGPGSVAIGDLNGDGKADLAVTNLSSNSVSVFINNGNGTFAAKADYTTGTSPFTVAIGDLNGDGKADLAVANQVSSNNVSVLMNNGDGTFATKVDYTAGSGGPTGIAIGDLNGDGKADLAVANQQAPSNNVSVFMNNGDGTFATKVDYATGTSPGRVTIGDLNGDGKADLAVTNNGSTSVSIFMNQPQTMFFADATTGNIGIGTTTVTEIYSGYGNQNNTAVEIAGIAGAADNQYANLILSKPQSGTSNLAGVLTFANTAVGGAEKRLAQIHAVTDGATNSGLLGFGTSDAGTFSTKMVINSTGNVGIGTTIPSEALLHVSTADAASSFTALKLSRGNSSDGEVVIHLNGGGTSITRGAQIKAHRIGSGNSHDLSFWTNVSSASPTESMRITAAGNVGIGIISPAAALEVASGAGQTARFGDPSITAGGWARHISFYKGITGGSTPNFTRMGIFGTSDTLTRFWVSNNPSEATPWSNYDFAIPAAGGVEAYQNIYAQGTRGSNTNSLRIHNQNTGSFIDYNPGLLTFRPAGTGTVANQVILAANGNVGVGVSPTSKLHVNGAVTSSGGAISLNASSNFVVNIGTGTTTSAVTIGGGSNQLVMNSSTWDISGAGVGSGFTGFNSTSIGGTTPGTGSFTTLAVNGNVTFANSADRSISMTTSPAGTVGRKITITAGSAGAGTNLGAGGLELFGGTGTGNSATSTIRFFTATPVASGTGGQGSTLRMIVAANGNVGIGNITTPTQNLHVAGNARFATIGSGAFTGAVNRMSDGTLTTATSDIRFKKDVVTIDHALDKVLALRGVTFNWKDPSNPKRMMGMIAQETIDIVPELVFQNEFDGYYGINYGEASGLLIEAIKEQQQQITTLNTVINQNNLTLSSTGDVVIGAAANDYSVTPVGGGPALTKIIGVAQGVIGKLYAGLVTTKDLVVTGSSQLANLTVSGTGSIASLTVNNLSVAGQSLQAYIENVVNNMQLNNSTSLPSGSFISELNTENFTATGSATLGETTAENLTVHENASISGDLAVASDASIAGNLTASSSRLGSLLADTAVLGSTTISGTPVGDAPLLDVRGSARMQALEAQVAQLSDVRALTATLYDATVSGTLFANTIAGLDEKVAAGLQPTLLQQLIGYDPAATASAQIISQITGVDLGSTLVIDPLSLADLPEDHIILGANAGFFEQYLQVNGNTALGGDLMLGGSLRTTGGITITGDSISYAPSLPDSSMVLKIQPSGIGGLDLMNGLALLENGTVTITGDVTFTKNITVEETLFTDLLAPTNFETPIQVKVAGVATESGEVRQSRFEIINELDTPVATISAQGQAAFAGGISVGREDIVSPDASGSATVAKSSGKAVIPAGATQIRLLSDRISPDTLIYVTPQGDTANQSLYIKNQIVGEAVIGFNAPLAGDLRFNWWIVE